MDVHIKFRPNRDPRWTSIPRYDAVLVLDDQEHHCATIERGEWVGPRRVRWELSLADGSKSRYFDTLAEARREVSHRLFEIVSAALKRED